MTFEITRDKIIKARDILYKDDPPSHIILSLDAYNSLVFEDDVAKYINQEQFELLGEHMTGSLVKISLTKKQE